MQLWVFKTIRGPFLQCGPPQLGGLGGGCYGFGLEFIAHCFFIFLATEKDQGFYYSAYVPRIFMIVAIVLISLALAISALETVLDIHPAQALVITIVFSTFELLGGKKNAVSSSLSQNCQP